MSDWVAYNPCSACKKDDLCNICELHLYRSGAISVDKWISVDERLPETRETILYFNGEWVDACYFDGDNFMTLDTYESDIIDGVTHWMPLPPRPKENKND